MKAPDRLRDLQTAIHELISTYETESGFEVRTIYVHSPGTTDRVGITVKPLPVQVKTAEAK